MAILNRNSNTFISEVQSTTQGTVPAADNSSIGSDLTAWNSFKTLLNKSVAGGSLFSSGVVSTYSLVYTYGVGYAGGVLAPNGDIHFVPNATPVGLKVSAAGVVSTYSLVYTGSYVYTGGVLAPNGDIHFIPAQARGGVRIKTNTGVLSTYR